MDTVSYAIVIEEISRACANMGVILSVNNSLVCDPIEKFGNEDQKKRFLTPLARGEKLGCFALTEPDAGSDAGNQKTRAVREGDVYRISGQKVFITCGPDADVCLLFAMTHPEKKARGISAFLVDASTPGLRPLAPPGQARRQRLGHGRDLPDGRARPRRRPARRGGRRLQDRDGDARRRPHRDRRAGGRHRAGGLRGRGLATRRRARRSASRSPTSRSCASTSPTWRPSIDAARLLDAQGGGGEGRGRRRRAAATRWKPRSPSSSRPRWRSASPRRRSRSTAATATRRSIRSSATSATRASPRSTKARARSTG